MTDLRIYFASFLSVALGITAINSILTTIVLLFTIVFTVLRIEEKLNERKKDGKN